MYFETQTTNKYKEFDVLFPIIFFSRFLFHMSSFNRFINYGFVDKLKIFACSDVYK